MRFSWILFSALLFGCASEEWDNRFDPDADAYRGPCAGAPADVAVGCVFWEDFDHGFSRWMVSGTPSDVAEPSIVNQGPYGSEAKLLALPGCDGKGPSLVTEIELPGGEVQISVIWVSEPDAKGQLALEARGAILNAAEGPAEEERFDGWRESFTTLVTQPGERTVLRIINVGEAGESCDQIGLYVASVWVREVVE